MRRIALALATAALALGVAGLRRRRRTGRLQLAETRRSSSAPAPSRTPRSSTTSRTTWPQKAGLKLEVKEFTDYVLPNTALVDHQLDANYFQTPPYLADSREGARLQGGVVVGVHIEPLGLYSQKVKDARRRPERRAGRDPQRRHQRGPRAAPARRQRADHAQGRRRQTATPRHRQQPEEPRSSTRSRPPRRRAPSTTPTLAVINGNYAIEADLTPSKDALVLEAAENNPYANSS